MTALESVVVRGGVEIVVVVGEKYRVCGCEGVPTRRIVPRSERDEMKKWPLRSIVQENATDGASCIGMNFVLYVHIPPVLH